jgi:hypothetical protein
MTNMSAKTGIVTLILLAMAVFSASAQTAANGGTVTGIVKDTTGAIIPGATLPSPATTAKRCKRRPARTAYILFAPWLRALIRFRRQLKAWSRPPASRF